MYFIYVPHPSRLMQPLKIDTSNSLQIDIWYGKGLQLKHSAI